jgi:hypothetical protein
MGEWSYNSTFLDVCPGCQLHDPAAVAPGKESPPRCPLNMRLGEPQSPPGRRGEEKNSCTDGMRSSGLINRVACTNWHAQFCVSFHTNGRLNPAQVSSQACARGTVRGGGNSVWEGDAVVGFCEHRAEASSATRAGNLLTRIMTTNYLRTIT